MKQFSMCQLGGPGGRGIKDRAPQLLRTRPSSPDRAALPAFCWNRKAEGTFSLATSHVFWRSRKDASRCNRRLRFCCDRRHVFCFNRKHMFYCKKELPSAAAGDLSSAATARTALLQQKRCLMGAQKTASSLQQKPCPPLEDVCFPQEDNRKH